METLTKPYVGQFDLSTRCLVTVIVLIAALALTGDWLILFVHGLKYFGILRHTHVDREIIENTLTSLRLQNVDHFLISSMLAGFGIYYGIGFFLHWNYYVRQKHQPEKWKCQPKKWLPRQLELDEIKDGSIALLVVNTWSALLSCYIYNGGYCTVYYAWDEYGVLWWILQIPLLFVYQDYLTYWLHRIFHCPYLYKKFHKLHHKYRQPTAFSVTAIHPLEISLIQAVLVIPLFAIPIHWVAFHLVALYTYYHGILTHSGINFKAQWWQPWQPDAIFHDNHHQYYHVNFGFNCTLWDNIHGTYRRPDRVYNEKIFYGKGKPITSINEEELELEVRERNTETRTGFSIGYNPYMLNELKCSN